MTGASPPPSPNPLHGPLAPREAVLHVLASQAQDLRNRHRPVVPREWADRLFTALTGEPPGSPEQSVRSVRVDVPPALAALVDRARANALGDDRDAARRWLADVVAAVGLGGAMGVNRPAPRRQVARRRAVWTMAALIAVLAFIVVPWRPSAPADGVAPPLGMSLELAMRLQGLTEQADATLRRDDFAVATAAYQRYGELTTDIAGGALLTGWTDARLAYTRHLTTDATGTEAFASSAIGIFDRSGVGDHPWRVAALAISGTALAQRGAFESAAQAFAEAVAMRERLLGMPTRRGLMPSLVSALERVGADAEWDEDGLLNIFELMLGLDQRQPDSDGDGLGDADELDADGWPHVVRFGLAQDATRVLGTAGSRAPAESGFWQAGHGEVAPIDVAGVSAIRLTSARQLAFHAPFSSEQKRAVPVQGWRLFLRVRPERGRLTADVDAMPALGPCRLTLERQGDGLRASVNGAAVHLDVATADALALLELFYDPSRKAVRLRLRDKIVLERPVTPDHVVSPWGLTFGVESDDGAAAAVLATVLFEIRF